MNVINKYNNDMKKNEIRHPLSIVIKSWNDIVPYSVSIFSRNSKQAINKFFRGKTIDEAVNYSVSDLESQLNKLITEKLQLSLMASNLNKIFLEPLRPEMSPPSTNIQYSIKHNFMPKNIGSGEKLDSHNPTMGLLFDINDNSIKTMELLKLTYLKDNKFLDDSVFDITLWDILIQKTGMTFSYDVDIYNQKFDDIWNVYSTKYAIDGDKPKNIMGYYKLGRQIEQKIRDSYAEKIDTVILEKYIEPTRKINLQLDKRGLFDSNQIKKPIEIEFKIKKQVVINRPLDIIKLKNANDPNLSNNAGVYYYNFNDIKMNAYSNLEYNQDGTLNIGHFIKYFNIMNSTSNMVFDDMIFIRDNFSQNMMYFLLGKNTDNYLTNLFSFIIDSDGYFINKYQTKDSPIPKKILASWIYKEFILKKQVAKGLGRLSSDDILKHLSSKKSLSSNKTKQLKIDIMKILRS